MKGQLILLAATSVFMASCCTDGPSPKVQPVSPSAVMLREQVNDVQASIQNVTAPLDESSQHIGAAKTIAQTNNNQAILSELNFAQSNLDKGRNLLNDADVKVAIAAITATQVVANAQQCDRAVKSLQGQIESLEKKLNSESKWVYKMLAGIAAVMIVAGIGICVASATIGFGTVRIGAGVSAGGVALLIITLTLQKYEMWFMIACGVLLLATGVYFYWKLFVADKANKELVQTGEAIKGEANKANPALTKQIFGDNSNPHPNSVADSIQSDSTQQIVKAMRKQLELTGTRKKFASK